VKLKRKCLPLKSPRQNNSQENVLRRTTKGAADFEKGFEGIVNLTIDGQIEPAKPSSFIAPFGS